MRQFTIGMKASLPTSIMWLEEGWSNRGLWLSATGLAPTTGMRTFGTGVDQVTQMEMVLPSGHHVRFGPTSWKTDDPDLFFPRTTQVTGWCNNNPVQNEDDWGWEDCTDDEDIVDFNELWHAVRGGGGGYGVVTSVEYQLPDYPGELSKMTTGNFPENVTGVAADACGSCESFGEVIQIAWENFFIDILWNPAALNVTEAESALCGGPNGPSFYAQFFDENGLPRTHRGGYFEISGSLKS